MSRLYDRIMDGRLRFVLDSTEQAAPGLREIMQLLSGAQVVAIDEVARYYFQSVDKYASWRITDFPNLAPPFDNLWLEFSGDCYMPLLAGVSSAQPYHSIGCFLTAVDLDGLAEKPQYVAPYLSASEWQSARWIINGIVAHQGSKSDPAIARASFAYVVGPDGSLFLGDSKPQFRARLFAKQGQDWNKEEASYMVAFPRSFLYPCFLAISFLHCKNVTLTANDPPPKLNKAREKRGKKPLVRYYTLNIEPMKEVLRREGQIEKTGLKKALHICRGHFAQYGDAYGKGKLFGKYEGQFWMPMHVRGSLSEGAVVKDYNVKTPKTTP